MVQTAENNCYIDPQLHERFNTKRGLRNSDGTGVLVGLTAIGDVHSYIVDEHEKSPWKAVCTYRELKSMTW